MLRCIQECVQVSLHGGFCNTEVVVTERFDNILVSVYKALSSFLESNDTEIFKFTLS